MGWTVGIGDALSRAERSARYGGATQGGIEPSASTPNVFLYTDPSRGAVYGYNYDGWSPDGSVFLYTGDGQDGDQTFTGGNRSLLEHEAAGRALRLFVADGLVPGTGTKVQRYVGEFVVADPPYMRAEAPDRAGELRSVYVFRLMPVGDVLRRKEDVSEAGAPAPSAVVEWVDLEAHNAPTFPTAGSAPGTAERRESELVGRYTRHLEKQGHKVRRVRIRPPGELRSLLTDPFDETAGELYEAKGTSTRACIRTALGQLFDYSRFLPPSDLTVLLPSQPSDDLVQLLHSRGVGCVYETSVGVFMRRSPATT